MDVKDRIKEQRTALGITQQQLAFDTGLSIDGIRSIESGRAKPNIDTLSKLADRFGCTTDFLLGRTDTAGLVSIETWDEFHDYMEQIARLLSLFDKERAKRVRVHLRQYPTGEEKIPETHVALIKKVIESSNVL